MADVGRPALPIGHPAPLKNRVSNVRLYSALAAGPLAWVAQLLIGFAFPSFLCFRNLPRLPEAAVSPDWMGPLLATANLAALIVCAVAFAVSIALLRRTNDEHQQNSGGVLEAGEGRTRYLAVWALFTSGLFFVAVGFNTINLFLVPTCPA